MIAAGSTMLGLLRLPAPAGQALRGMSSVVQQMVEYARTQAVTGIDQGVDVLRSGLSMQADPTRGSDSANLLLAMAELECERCNWSETHSLASKSMHAAASCDSDLQLQAAAVATRALLVQGGQDQAALTLASQLAPGSSSTSASAPALLLHALLATSGPEAGEAGEASGAREAAAHGLQQQLGSHQAAGPSCALPAAHKVLGDFHFVRRRWEAAASSYGTAAQLASAALQPAGSVSMHPSPAALREVEADALLGSAQVQVAARDWKGAEETLGAALKAAERVSHDQHPRLALALLLLGQVYSRTARVTFAEGMLREGAKLLRLDPVRAAGQGAGGGSHGKPAHGSLLAALAWRFAQLLAALPANRGGEMQLWQRCAEQHWRAAGAPYGACGGGLVEVLGDLAVLKGVGAAGSGALVSLASRRLLLVQRGE